MNKSLVFIHGIGLGDWVFQENFVPYFESSGFTVHNVNLPAHEASSTSLERQKISLDYCVNFLDEFLTKEVNNSFVLVGMSMGGAICQRLLSRGYSNQNLKGLVLLSSVPPASNLPFTLRLCRNLALTKPELLVDFFSGKTNFELFFSPQSLEAMSTDKIKYYRDKVLTGFSRLEYEIFFQDLMRKPLKIDIPLKIIGGEDDLLFPPELMQFTASYYSQKAEILPGLGHMIPIEINYSKGIKAIEQFLKEVF